MLPMTKCARGLPEVMAARVQYLQQVILNLSHECNRSNEFGNGARAASHGRIPTSDQTATSVITTWRIRESESMPLISINML